MRVLVVEDDPRMGESVTAYLRGSGFAVDLAADGAAARRALRLAEYDAVVLDLTLPDTDGTVLCDAIRAAGQATRILMATARDAVPDRVRGLNAGADDYLVKPYALEELVARLRALLRRPAAATTPTLTVGDLTLDPATRLAARGARTITLTTKEFAVLEVFLRHPGEVLTREHISTHAWDENYDPLSNVIDVYVARLRKKVDGPGEPPLFSTLRGAGWRLGVPRGPGVPA